jgi:hypothetical protein
MSLLARFFSKEPMRQGRFADEQATAVLREANRLREIKKSRARGPTSETRC